MSTSPFSNLFGGPVKKNEADSLAEIQPETRFEPEPEPEKEEEKALEKIPEIPEMENFGGFANEFEEGDEDAQTGDTTGFPEPPPVPQQFEIQPPPLPETRYEVPEPEQQPVAKKEEPIQSISANPYREPETVIASGSPINPVAPAPKQEKPQVGFNDLFGNNQEEEPKKEQETERKEEQESEAPVQESSWEGSDTSSAWDTQEHENRNATETPEEPPEKEEPAPQETSSEKEAETLEVETAPEIEPDILPETNDATDKERDPKQVEESPFGNPFQKRRKQNRKKPTTHLLNKNRQVSKRLL